MKSATAVGLQLLNPPSDQPLIEEDLLELTEKIHEFDAHKLDTFLSSVGSVVESAHHTTYIRLRLFYIACSTTGLSTVSDKILTDGIKNGGRSADLAMRQIVKRHIGYVKQQAAKSGGLTFDDACSRGIEGLWTAAMKYDAERGASFLTYARRWVFRNTQNRGTKADTALPQLPSDDWAPEDKKSDIANWVRSQDVAEAMAGLEPKIKDVIFERFFNGRTLEEVARELDISKVTVIKRLKIGFRILKDHLKGYESEVDNV